MQERATSLGVRLPSVLAGFFAFSTATGNFFLTVYFSEELGFDGAEIGILYALQAMAGVLAALPAGIGSDRVLARHLVALSLAVQAVGFTLLAGLDSFVPFAAAFLLLNVANSTFRYSLDIHVLKSDDGQRTVARVGSYQAARFAGMAAGTAGAGYLLSAVEFRFALLATAAATAILSVCARTLPPTPLERSSLAAYLKDLTSPGVAFFCVWLVLFSTHWGAEFTSYSLFLREGLHLSMVDMGWYMAVEFAAIVVTILLFVRFHRTPRVSRAVIVFGLLASGAGHIGMVLQPVSISCAFRFLHGIGDGLIFMVFYLGVARFFVAERTGGNAGIVNTMTMLGMVLGALFFGPLGEAFGYSVPLWTSGLLTMFLAVPLLSHVPAAREPGPSRISHGRYPPARALASEGRPVPRLCLPPARALASEGRPVPRLCLPPSLSHLSRSQHVVGSIDRATRPVPSHALISM